LSGGIRRTELTGTTPPPERLKGLHQASGFECRSESLKRTRLDGSCHNVLKCLALRHRASVSQPQQGQQQLRWSSGVESSSVSPHVKNFKLSDDRFT
jgi:hypothetical protein